MLVAKNISKDFAGVVALNNVSMELHEGKVTAIIGENGAGKSTLMKILSGVYTDFQGEIILNGVTQNYKNTKDAEAAGISIIHQELNLVQDLSIAENIFLGHELVNGIGLLDQKKMLEESRAMLATLDLTLDPSTLVRELKVGQQQLIEIAKALLLKSKVIIMDEPTSAISNKEVEDLFRIIHNLREDGKIIVYISHKLQELLKIADRYVVMRDGCVISEGSMEGVGQDELIQLMSGRNTERKRTVTGDHNETIFAIKDFGLKIGHQHILRDISFEMKKGEVVGLYGLMGAGRTELLESVFGLHGKLTSGKMEIHGLPVSITSPAKAVENGLALVPEDRKSHGLHVNHSIRKNISMSVLGKLQKWGWLMDASAEYKLSAEKIQALSVKTSNDDLPAMSLSGGNQQKVVLAKWLSTDPQILLLDEPTRGVDVHSKSEIHALILQLAESGMTVLVVSSEIPEILAVSDRILVMSEGRITYDIPIDEANETVLLKHAIPGGMNK